jgi:hypothetical protein
MEFKMQAVYYTNLDELTVSFLDMLKKQFSNAKVELVIRQKDETDYLNSSETNRKLLEEAMLEVEESKLITKSMKDLNL